MSLDETLSEIKSQRVFVLASGELWPELDCTQDDEQTLLGLLLASDIQVCPARNLHRRFFRYAGQGRYTCSKCQELLPEVG